MEVVAQEVINASPKSTPTNWKVMRLGEVCEFEYGKALKKDLRDENGPYDVFGSNGIVGKHSSFIINEACIIVGRKGAAGEVHLSPHPCWPIDTTYFIRQNGKYDIKFMYYQLKSLQLNSLDKSTAIPGLNRNDAYRKLFVLPPLSEQQAIVAKIEQLFSELDRGKQQLETALQQLKVYRQAVLKWAFEGKFTNPEVKEVKLPKEWKWVKIGEVANSLDNLRKPVNKEERLKRQGNIPYYGANGRTGWIDAYLFDEPLILVVEDETFVGRELPFSYKITGKSWVNNHAHILKPKEGLDINFLNYQLAYYPFLPLTTGTTGRKKLTKNALMNAPFKICSIDEQQLVVEEIESRLSVCDKVEKTITQSLQQAEVLRQSILKQAFEGKLFNLNNL